MYTYMYKNVSVGRLLDIDNDIHGQTYIATYVGVTKVYMKFVLRRCQDEN